MASALAFLDGIGTPELIVIGILALLMFGSKRMPELGRGLGRAIREFKRATSGVEENLREVLREEPLPTIRPPLRQGTPRNAENPFTQTTADMPAIEASVANTSASPPAPQTHAAADASHESDHAPGPHDAHGAHGPAFDAAHHHGDPASGAPSSHDHGGGDSAGGMSHDASSDTDARHS